MKTILSVFVLTVLCGLCSLTTTAVAQISVVVAKSSPHRVSKEEAKNMFLGNQTTWANGAKVQIADQSDSDVGKEFYGKYIGKTPNQVKNQWFRLVLAGQGKPVLKCSDDEAVKKAVAADPNVIGFIATKSLDASVKELFKIE